MKPETPDIDSLLDRALASYLFEPQFGIETRVLRRVQSEGIAAQRRVPAMPAALWSAAALVASAVIITVGISVSLRDRPQLVEPRQTALIPSTLTVPGDDPKTSPQNSSLAGGKSAARHLLAANDSNTRRAKLAVFPTPRPLSNGEFALLQAAIPVPLQKADQEQSTGALQVGAIQIVDLEIKPLNIDGDR